jgi:hypothetical protein
VDSKKAMAYIDALATAAKARIDALAAADKAYIVATDDARWEAEQP